MLTMILLIFGALWLALGCVLGPCWPRARLVGEVWPQHAWPWPEGEPAWPSDLDEL